MQHVPSLGEPLDVNWSFLGWEDLMERVRMACQPCASIIPVGEVPQARCAVVNQGLKEMGGISGGFEELQYRSLLCLSTERIQARRRR